MVIKDSLIGVATRLQTPPSQSDNYKRLRERKEADELLAAVQDMAERLGEAGNQYAQLLGEQQMAQERKAVVELIRFQAELILSKTELPGSESVLEITRDLAITE